MDVGMAPPAGEPPMKSLAALIAEGRAPLDLSDEDQTRVFDALLACEATWHRGQALATTVYTCLYMHDEERLEACRGPAIMRAYFDATRSAVATVRHAVSSGDVWEEEDFVLHVAGFDVGAAAVGDDAAKPNAALARPALAETWLVENAGVEDRRGALLARVRFRIAMHEAYEALFGLADPKRAVAAAADARVVAASRGRAPGEGASHDGGGGGRNRGRNRVGPEPPRVRPETQPLEDGAFPAASGAFDVRSKGVRVFLRPHTRADLSVRRRAARRESRRLAARRARVSKRVQARAAEERSGPCTSRARSRRSRCCTRAGGGPWEAPGGRRAAVGVAPRRRAAAAPAARGGPGGRPGRRRRARRRARRRSRRDRRRDRRGRAFSSRGRRRVRNPDRRRWPSYRRVCRGRGRGRRGALGAAELRSFLAKTSLGVELLVRAHLCNRSRSRRKLRRLLGEWSALVDSAVAVDASGFVPGYLRRLGERAARGVRRATRGSSAPKKKKERKAAEHAAEPRGRAR